MNIKSTATFRILVTGAEFHGSDSGGLARAFRRLGHLVQIVDEDRYSPAFLGFIPRLIRKAIRPVSVREFNREILRQCESFEPHFVLVCKGTMVAPWALLQLKQKGRYLMNFYPDVSFMCHGPLIPQCLPIYDHIFTTKTFGIADMKSQLNVTNSEFIPHGFDPDLHRLMTISSEDMERFGVDASFIGTWSPKKTAFLAELAKTLPGIHLRVWGSQWEKADSPSLKPHIAGVTVTGDIFPFMLQCTKINIAILSEARAGASSGDLITSRTFHIPASGGFMLHERTDELLEYYNEGEEVACFSTPEEMAEKVKYYLDHEDERERIRLAGHRRCVAENSFDHRARKIVELYSERSRTT